MKSSQTQPTAQALAQAAAAAMMSRDTASQALGMPMAEVGPAMRA